MTSQIKCNLKINQKYIIPILKIGLNWSFLFKRAKVNISPNGIVYLRFIKIKFLTLELTVNSNYLKTNYQAPTNPLTKALRCYFCGNFYIQEILETFKALVFKISNFYQVNLLHVYNWFWCLKKLQSFKHHVEAQATWIWTYSCEWPHRYAYQSTLLPCK